MRDGDERQPREDVPDRERQGRLGELERADRPQEPDREHLGPGAVVGALEGGDRPGCREDEPRDGDHRDEGPRLTEVRGRDEIDGAGVEHDAEGDCSREPASGHRRRKRTAVPVSSALAMKPRAPLERIRPL